MTTLNFEQMEGIEGGKMACWVATALALATAAAAGDACATVVACAGGIAAMGYAYDVWLTSCGYQN